MTKATSTTPVQIAPSVKPATRSRFGRGALKPRFTRSCGPGVVPSLTDVRRIRARLDPGDPSPRIGRAPLTVKGAACDRDPLAPYFSLINFNIINCTSHSTITIVPVGFFRLRYADASPLSFFTFS